jgi:hypothetical protein
MTHVTRIVPLGRMTAIGCVVLALGASTAGGQQAAIYGAGLQAWYGCWSPDPGSAARIDGPPPLVCIAPTADVNVADVLTLQDGKVVARETLDATGRSRPIDAARCTGVRSAAWSRDGRRLFVRSSGRCAGVPSTTSGLLSITTEGDWLDVEGVSAGGGTSVRVARYREVALPTSLPPGIASALRTQALATRSVRTAAGVPVRAEDLLEAARAVDSAVLESWILERAQRFAIAEHEITSLVSAGVPVRAADALGAVADPQGYGLARADEPGAAMASVQSDDGYGLPFGWGWGAGFYLPIGTRYAHGSRDPRRHGYYRPPLVIVRRGRPLGWDERGRGKPDGGGRTGSGSGTERPGAAASPPRGDPRRTAPSPPSGGTVRLGKPR